MTSASLDGKPRKGSTSARNSTPSLSSATKQSPRYEPMPHLSRADPEAGLRPASPPKTNPWTRMAKPRKIQTDASSPTDSNPPLSASLQNGRSRASSRSSGFNPASVVDSEAGSSGEVNPTHIRSPSRDSSMSLASSLQNDPSVCTNRTLRSLSTGSEDSRRALLAAALHVEENLWKHPFGADVKVTAGARTFLVHRDIVTAQSGWFKQNLPERCQDGSPVEVSIRCAPEAVGYCLRYMYTQKIEICDDRPIFSKEFLPRCVLLYCAAVHLRIKGMVTHVLRIVEASAADLKETLTSLQPGTEAKRFQWLAEYTEDHLWDALILMYSQVNQELMKPMRMAMASIIDMVFVLLLHRVPLRRQLHEGAWQWLLPRILGDQLHYLRISDDRPVVVTEDAAIETLLANDNLRAFSSLTI